MNLSVRTSILLLLLCFSALSLKAQSNLLPTLAEREFHQIARENLRKAMPDSSMAVFFSSPVVVRANDVNYPYHQDPSFFYYSGFAESSSILVVLKEPRIWKGRSTNEIIFVEEKDPSKELWNGKRLGVELAKESLGIAQAELIKEFASTPLPWNLKNIYFWGESNFISETNEENQNVFDAVFHALKQSRSGQNSNRDFVKSNETLGRLNATLRQIKHPVEIENMRKAIDITGDAQMELMRALNPEMSEYHAQAIVEYVFRAGGAEGVAFPSILGSGENSCTLHYTENSRKFKDGDLIVADIGAEYRGYAADITRTLPVNGKFTEEQKEIYNLVLKAQLAGIEACKPGNQFMKPGQEANKIIAAGLKKLGIISSESEVRRYFMHGTSHYLGLDVHDDGVYAKLYEGMVLTVEPGIYIAEGSPCDKKWWNIGVRIEDDVLITKAGNEVLSSKSPKTIEEIERLMKENGNFKINFEK